MGDLEGGFATGGIAVGHRRRASTKRSVTERIRGDSSLSRARRRAGPVGPRRERRAARTGSWRSSGPPRRDRGTPPLPAARRHPSCRRPRRRGATDHPVDPSVVELGQRELQQRQRARMDHRLADEIGDHSIVELHLRACGRQRDRLVEFGRRQLWSARSTPPRRAARAGGAPGGDRGGRHARWPRTARRARCRRRQRETTSTNASRSSAEARVEHSRTGRSRLTSRPKCRGDVVDRVDRDGRAIEVGHGGDLGEAGAQRTDGIVSGNHRDDDHVVRRKRQTIRRGPPNSSPSRTLPPR